MVANLETTDRPSPSAVSDASHYSDPVHIEALSLLDKLHTAGNKPSLETGYIDFGSVGDIFPASSPRLSATSESQIVDSSFSKGKQTTITDSATLAPSLEAARENLIEVASKDISGPGKLQAFEQDMKAFEKRMTNDSPVEVQQFYTQMARLLSQPSAVMSESNKILLAEGMMHDAADPDGIRQGASVDCVSASLESKAYTEAPAQTAKTLTDVALTGSYTTSDGRVITPTTGIKEPIKNDQFGGVERSFSDQIFQVTAMNTYMDAENQWGNTPGRYHYQIAPSPVAEVPYLEEQVDNSTNPPTTRIITGIGDLDENKLSGLYQKMTGIASNDFLIGEGEQQSLPQVQQSLLEARQTGQFPLEAGIDSASPLLDPDFEAIKNTPLYKALEQALAKSHHTPEQIEQLARQGGHAIAIEGYDPKTETVTYMDSELGTVSKTSLLDLVRAMDIEPYPQADNQFGQFLNSEDYNRPLDKQIMDYLKTVPQAQRQETFSELMIDGDVSPLTLSDSELKALGVTDPDSGG
jgi:hypothetical protein